MFISFEGLDFCGKSTQISLLKKYLETRGEKAVIIREPGGTNISEKIRDILLDKNNSEMYFKTEVLLFAASRAQLVNEVIIPKLEEGYFILSDRFHDSSIAYQGYGRGISPEFVIELQNYVINNAVPALTFFIDVSLEEVEKRKLLKSYGRLDRIERMDRKFYKRVRDGYNELALKEKRIYKINGLDTIESIHSQIVKIVEKIKNWNV